MMPGRRRLGLAEQFRPDSDPLPASPDIDDSARAQLSLGCHPDHIQTSANQYSQTLKEYRYSTEHISTSLGIENLSLIPLTIDFQQNPCSTSQKLDTGAQPQSMNGSFHQQSDSITASVSLDPSEPSITRDVSPHIGVSSNLRVSDAVYDDTINDYHVQIPSEVAWTPLLPDILDHAKCIADLPHSPNETGFSSQNFDCATQEPSMLESDCQHAGVISNLPALDTIDPNLAVLSPHKPSLAVVGLHGTGKYQHDEFHEQPSNSFSSYAVIDTPEHTESSGEYQDASVDHMAIQSHVNTDEHSKYNDGLLRQSLGRIPASPHLAALEQPQPFLLYPHDETVVTLPILDTLCAQPQFTFESPGQFFEVNTPSRNLNNPDHSPCPDEEEKEEDVSPLEYARTNGLSRDYLKQPYLVSNLTVFGDYDGLTDDSHLPQFDLSAKINTDEPLTISKDAALLIASISREESSEWIAGTVLRMIDTRKYKHFRFELPLLKSDHETDWKSFAQWEGFEVKLHDVKLPSEVVDDNNNGGLKLSPNLWRKGVEVLETIKKEKLEVSRDTLVYLQRALKNDWTDENQKKVCEFIHTYKRNTALEPVTPPLSPMIVPAEPYEPSMSDPVFELPILSDPESLTKQDLEAIERHIFENDVPTPVKNTIHRYDGSSDTLVGSDNVKMADIYSPAASLDLPPLCPSVETTRTKRRDLKVEECLTPAKPSEIPKAIRFSDEIMECPLVAESPRRDPFESSFFEEAFGEAHAKATRNSEQETLIAADTTARVDVPIMDFNQPIPPCNGLRKNPCSSILDAQKAMMNETIGQSPPKWPSNGKFTLRWNPFLQNVAKVALEDEFVNDDSAWQIFLQGSENDTIIDTSTLTWKPPGLRILKEDDDDDEIESAQFEKERPHDLLYLVKKRKLEIEGAGDGFVSSTVAQDNATNAIAKQLPKKNTSKPNEFVSAAEKLPSDPPDIGGAFLMGGVFSVENSVDNFLEIRGLKKLKLDDSSYPNKTSSHAKAQLPPAQPDSQPELMQQLSIRNSSTPRTDAPLPTPPIKATNASVNVIVASTLLKCRPLIKHIEALFQRIVLVERDFSAHDTTTWMPGSVARSPIVSPLASEADIIVSPSLGIIITTLQKIKQKPLPGQKSKPAIRARLEKVSARYEKLIVLVTEGREDETARELDDSDCAAFSEFVAFTLTLQATVSVQYIGGGEATLAKWIANAVSYHAVGEELLADETHWELFLRRTGLNAFAAQSIIAALKAPDGIETRNPSRPDRFGLAAFVAMGAEQRSARFGPICGHRLMARVSAVVDARWL